MDKLLTEVCDIQYGFPFDSGMFNDSEGIPLIRIRDVKRGYSETFTTEKYTEEYVVNEGDILIGMDGEFNIAKWGKIPAVLNQRVCRVFPHGDVDADYIFYSLPSELKKIEARTSFATVKHLSAREINKIQIPVPLLEEQRVIAKKIAIVTDVITKRKKQLEQFDLLIQSRFVELFGDPETNHKGWNECALSERLNVLGGYAFKSDMFDENGGIPVLRIGNINSGYFKPVNMVFWKEDENLERYAMYPGDLVMSLTGTVGKDDYGNVCILGNDYDKYYLNQRNAKLEIKDGIDKFYLSELLKFDPVKKRLTGISRGVRQANISNKDILNLIVPVPPIELQNQFADFVKQVEKSKIAVQKALDETQLLFDSLMQEYFG